MRRAVRVIAGGHANDEQIIDSVILPYERRQSPQGDVRGLKGTAIRLALSSPSRLRHDDLLMLEGGGAVEVVAEPEPLIEARANDVSALARLAWHLGDRHIPVQLLPNRIRVRREPAAEQLLRSLGARVSAIDAPFEPEGGAYMAHHQAHDHRNHHRDHHEHGHHHHRDDRNGTE